VAGVYPWPATDGYRLRMSNMIVGLAEAGPVDFFCVQAWIEDVEVDAPDGVNLFTTRASTTSRLSRLRSWAIDGLPRIMLNRTVDDARATFADWARDDYDLVYFSHADTWWYFRDLVDAPTICDLDNLEHLATRASRKLAPTTKDPATWVRWIATQPVQMVDERRLERLQLNCARDVDVVTLCSQLDVERSEMPNAVSIPNGYELGWEPRLDRAANVADPPVFSFVALQSYGPNADASRWMATQVLPRVREEVPGAQFRVVGRQGETLVDLAGLPGVTITGAVDDLEAEMQLADVAVVPIRFGAGTRLKVPEALANRIPVVTTTIGCEGIDVIDGTHALIADDVDSFVSACLRAANDHELRERLITDGAELFAARYRWATIRSELADLAREVAAHGAE
jgi:hypothetical protein